MLPYFTVEESQPKHSKWFRHEVILSHLLKLLFYRRPGSSKTVFKFLPVYRLVSFRNVREPTIIDLVQSLFSEKKVYSTKKFVQLTAVLSLLETGPPSFVHAQKQKSGCGVSSRDTTAGAKT